MSSIALLRFFTSVGASALIMAAFFCPLTAGAATTDIANEPLISKSNVSAKPNIMFILDNSGSMDWTYMPDELGYYDWGRSQYLPYNWYGYKSFQCNGLAYNPAVTYLPPINSDGVTFYPNRSFTATFEDGYSAATPVDLSRSTQTYYRYTGSQLAMNWQYNSDGTTNTTSTFYRECSSAIGSSPGNGVFSSVTVTAASTDAANYANWYAYYRKRYLLMRTAAGKAFSVLDSGYRVGFTTINNSDGTVNTGVSDDGTTSSVFRDVRDFDSTQKTNFYNSFYSIVPGAGTPLRVSLSKVGSYFANKVSGQSYDPVQYACQRNFTILSTDGYWNSGPGYQLDGATLVGNQDGNEVRPMLDGTTQVTAYSQTKYVIGAKGVRCSRDNRCSSSQYCVTETPQTGASNGGPWTDGTSSAVCRAASYTINSSPVSTASASAGKTVYSAVTSFQSTSGGSSESLADVAEYYYTTDLRTPTLSNCTSATSGETDVCSNIIKASGRDTQAQQHMTTFSIGLGVNGTLTYDRNYLTQTSGAYVNLTNGTVNWPVPGNTASLASPNSINGDARNIDDLWHAAVNGRGQYYSALNSSDLAQAISGIVSSIQATTGAGSAPAVSSLDMVSGPNNMSYQASYATVAWTGDILAYSVDGATAAASATETWSARSLLDSATAANRNIYFNKSGTLSSFTYTNLGATNQAYFDNLCSKSLVGSQCSGLSATNRGYANNGVNLVDYLRGVRTYEESNSSSPLYRTRAHVLGDIINSTPVYVGAPIFAYTDAGYAAFKLAHGSRAPVVYAGANDGMLHAFDASSGAELWAFVPSAVMPNLYKLADASYGSKHAYFVDGEVIVGDIYVGGAWKSILVGGLNGGGRSYYALDITDPASPSLLWEFTDDNLGLSYGNPQIVKRKDGTWVVAFASGYNNNVGTGDGRGHLFIVDANAGTKLMDISTGVGSVSDPSGLAKINAWIADSSDNTALRFYGGDLYGNLWRFDIDDLVLPHKAAQLLAQFQESDGVTAQPITTMPRLTTAAASYPIVIVGTGRYLGTKDITDKSVQSIAAIKDSLTNSGVGVVRNNNNMVQQTITVSGSSSTSTTNAVNWASQSGWWFDLPSVGERIVTNMALTSNTLIAASAVPKGDVCTSGGSSWLYSIQLNSGSAAGSLYSDSALIVGFTVVKTSDNSTVVLTTDSTGGGGRVTPPGGGGGGTVVAPHRTSWRELAN